MRGRAGLLALIATAALAGCTLPAPLRVSTPIEHLPALAGDYLRVSRADVGTYFVYIRYPEDYRANPAKRYPIVYLLDGDSTFPYLAPHHLFLTYDDKLPEAILVGIAYGSFATPQNRREKDFGTGAAAFHDFLETRLIPTVERRVRADPARRVLVGQSRGGGFVLYSAYTSPDLFWGRIASNPSIHLHRDLFYGAAPEAARTDLRLAVASGTRERPAGREATLAYLNHHLGRPGPWSFRGLDIEGGTHAADLPTAYRRAMRWMFGLERAAQP